MADLGPRGLVRGALDNGLSFSIWPDTRDTVATVQIWVRTGTADEAAGQSGIAHMLEHMMFRGTPTHPDGAFDARVEELGLYVNAATWLDYTFYTGTGPVESVPELLALEGDRFANLSVDPDAFLPERDVVANERRQVVDAVPEAVLGEAFHAALFAGTSYAWPTIGHAADIAAYSADSVRAFHRARYSAGRIHVVVVGNVDPDDVRDRIGRAFGGLHPTGALPARRAADDHPPTRDSRPLPVASTRVLLGWRAPARPDARWPAWVVLDEILAAAESSRLTRRLDFDDHLVIDSSSMLYALAEPGAYELSLTLRRGIRAERALEAIAEELSELATDVHPDEIAGAVARVRTSQRVELAETAGRAELLGESWALAADPLAGLALDEQVARVTADDVRTLAAELRDTRPVVYIAEPA